MKTEDKVRIKQLASKGTRKVSVRTDGPLLAWAASYV